MSAPDPKQPDSAIRHERAGELFLHALELPVAARSSFLASECAGDPVLREEVESLLQAQAGASDFLEKPLLDQLARPPGSQESKDAIATGLHKAIGPYRLLELIGEGGMGEVWLAEQRQPVQRRVALKLIKKGMDTREVVARFETERQALALMDHPNIAKVLDAGSTPEGRPFFVMEYVPGMPITEYCDRHKLTARQRLELFVAVCEGVQHAHQKAILHRDLKPSNLLIAEIDGRPVPRIIDFGVAKATTGRLTALTMFTGSGSLVGTPLYMSPEQADSGGMDVDTRTDVYSLGVVLYELLVGFLPLDLSQTPLHQFATRLREEDAPRPSTKLQAAGKESTGAAAARSTDPPTLIRILRGDLDAITMKALEKERARRYATPAELAVDIGRYLRNEPVLARPASLPYQTRKYLLRNRLAVSFALTAAVLLASFVAAQTVELRRTQRERDRANRESERANRITDFMTGMFKVSDPSEARGNEIRAREILDRASKEIEAGLAKDPDLEARLMSVMGTVYRGLGLYSKAESLFTRASQVQRQALGPRHPDTLKTTSNLAAVLSEEGRYADAEKLARETLNTQIRELGPEHRDTLESKQEIAGILGNVGRFAEAEKLDRETLEAATRKFGPEDRLTAAASRDLASYLLLQRKYPEAEKAIRERLAIDRNRYGGDHREVFDDLYSLGVVLIFEFRYAGADQLYQSLLQAQRRVLGPEHPDTLKTAMTLANVLGDEKRYNEAERLYRETLETQDRTQGVNYAASISTLLRLGSLLSNQRRFTEGEKLLRQALDRAIRILGNDSPLTSVVAYNFACALAQEGKRDEAITQLRFAVEHQPHTRLRLEKDPDLKNLKADPRFVALTQSSQPPPPPGQKAP